MGASAFTGFAAWAVRGRSSQVFGPSVYHGNRGRRSIALTFDDGPSPGTLSLLEYLAAENVRATFFQCGMNVLRHASIARHVYASGHEIGNHTYSHPTLCPRFCKGFEWRSREFVVEQFARTQHIMRSELGIRPVLLRAPYGLRWFGIREAQQQLRLLGVMWTVIGHDWEWPAERVAALVLRRASPGGIVCLHDGRDIQPSPDVSEMLKALKAIVPKLKDAGYQFETVSEILQPFQSHEPGYLSPG